MTTIRVAAVQMRGGREIAANIDAAEALIREAARAGAVYVQTPEMTDIIERDRAATLKAIQPEDSNPAVARFRALARELGIHLHIGSLAIPLGGEQVANRGYMIAPDGSIAARYDKIHMFDVDLDGGESWRESRTYRSGDRAVVADAGDARIGMSICYDVRFPQLYRALAKGGANVLTAPAAFTKQTGEAHWHVLQRARAIENGAFVISAAHGGHHDDGRDTYGHSIVVDPWGRVIAESGTEPGILVADIDLEESAKARKRIPALKHDRPFAVPGETGGGPQIRVVGR
jgi:predicted amidohydrolase